MQNTWDAARFEAQLLLRKNEVQPVWPVLSALSGIFWPVALYNYIHCIYSGSLRFRHFWLAFVVGPLLMLVACVAVTVWTRVLLRRNALAARGFLVLCICLWVALASSFISSDRNFWWHMSSYYTYQDLASYTNIDPSTDQGQSFMDAGEVYFKEGTSIAVSEMVAFRSGSVFCAAPIVSEPLWRATSSEQLETGGPANVPLSGTVDFWAVGTDCCSPVSKTFNCGEVHDYRARAGLRSLRDDRRPFFLLAVQEWVARNCPTDDNTAKGLSKLSPLACHSARHPLFFHWVVDPLLQVDDYHNRAVRLYRMNLLLFFLLDLLLVLGLLWLLKQLGMK